MNEITPIFLISTMLIQADLLQICFYSQKTIIYFMYKSANNILRNICAVINHNFWLLLYYVGIILQSN